jgi:hypothetical protein
VVGVVTYASFQEFFEGVVQPMKATHPEDLRLDGRAAGGNWDVAGEFLYAGRTWRVHADSRYEPLTLAYEALTRRSPHDPFVIMKTKTGLRLDLAEDLQRGRGTRHRHLYAYADD